MSTPADDRIAAANRPNMAAKPPRAAVFRLAPVIIVLALVALAYGLGLHRDISFETLIRHRAAIDRFIAAHGVAAIAGYIGLYVAVTGLSLPCGAVMTLVGGFLFGPFGGTLAALAGALGGAIVIFVIARTAFGECLTRRAGPLAAKLAEGFRADAFSYLLFLRLVPFFPFWLVNLAPALFGVGLPTFVGATAIGILPATATFAVFGAGLGSVIAAQETQYNACLAAGRGDCSVTFDLSQVLTPTLICALVALALLALVPVVAKRIWRRKLGAAVPPEGV